MNKIPKPKPHNYYIAKYVYHGQDFYSYKMFDQQKNAIDYILELTKQGIKSKLYKSQEVELEYNVKVRR